MSVERFRECLERSNRKNVWFVSGRFSRKPEVKNTVLQRATDLFTLSATARALTITERLNAGFVRRSSDQRRPNLEQSFVLLSAERFITATRRKSDRPSWRLRPRNRLKSKRNGMTPVSKVLRFRLIPCFQRRSLLLSSEVDKSRNTSIQYGWKVQSLQNMKRIF